MRAIIHYRSLLLGSVLAGVGALNIAYAAESNVKKTVSMYAHVNRMVAFSNDGLGTDIGYYDMALSGSRFGVKATARSPELIMSAKFEVQFQENTSSGATTWQTTDNGGSFNTLRVSDVSFITKYGALFIGHGGSAAYGALKSDLSGTSRIQAAGYPIASGMGFAMNGASKGNGGNYTDNAYQVSDVIPDFGGAGRSNRIRYDTPRLAGFGLRVSQQTNSGFDAKATYAGVWGGTKIQGGIGYYNSAGPNSADQQISGSISVLHSSGVSLTYAYGRNDFTSSGGRRPTVMFGKAGYKTDYFSLGPTAVSVDWQNGRDGVNDGDKATLWGVGVIQKLRGYGTEVYAAYERISYDRGNSSISYNNINAGFVGARINLF